MLIYSIILIKVDIFDYLIDKKDSVSNCIVWNRNIIIGHLLTNKSKFKIQIGCCDSILTSNYLSL